MRALLFTAIAAQAACLTTHGVSVDDRTGWVDEADVHHAVELVFGEGYWTEASPGLEIAFVTTRAELEEGCDHRIPKRAHGCYWNRSGIGVTDTVTVLLPEHEVCLADAYESMLVHELIHRWQRDHGWPDGHPVELFGEPDEGGHGGLTGELEDRIAIEICPRFDLE